MTLQKGIFWLTLPNQAEPPVTPKFKKLAKHFHVTLQFGVSLIPEIKEMLGKTVEVKVVANCFDNRVQALKVELPEDVQRICNNAIPHMTISMADGVKPIESNNMLSGGHKEESVNMVIPLVYDFFLFG